ncbi:sugar phosphate isomerase/epimerase family protein [Arthrobacter bambusae]|uniref:sugar phosphate isomerase/epimerase family protein n=1 Tax=Arthrobacter bambusae TaxID=1338426 RepID=UPI00278999CC|nr:sugar phosphate isomerase/epimerase [Arthrobacter bambusae]MDQ0213469.1 sugar phosphate isomerase/epimerase [Arthrobacter bambusae]MDQ0237769.1 sugar phosphate isomerase/epimerase [Arthrobacter bambusae]
MAKIGVQAMMLKGSFAEDGAFETLRKVSAIGYNAVEISQIPMTPENVAELDRSRRELGMDIAALSVAMETTKGMPGDSLKNHFDKIVDDAKRLDTRLLRIGMMPFPAMKSIDAAVDFAKQANEYAENLREHGIGLYYHNHHIEFAKFDGKYMLDIIAENSPAMGMEIDVHWVQRGGLDPVRTLAKYAGRTAMVHLKDYRIGELPELAFGLLETGDIAGFMAEFKNVVQFAEVGEGNLDFPSIIPAAQAAGAEYLLVEQDELYGRTVWEALQTSYDNLVAMGHADLF